MSTVRKLLCGALALSIAASVAAPAGATTLIRQSLEDLVENNGTIVLGEVVDVRSYWNEEKSFILTDVRIALQEVLKGWVKGQELTITIPGGAVDGLTARFDGAPELIPGRSYMLFLNEENLPGVRQVRTTRDHCQAVFDLVPAGDDLRAVSQASRQPLVRDTAGLSNAPGGREGLPLASLKQSIRDLVEHPQAFRQEVKR